VQNGVGCVVPPTGANFYPYFSVRQDGACTFLFGNMARHDVINDFGKDAQYGTPNLSWFGGESTGGPLANPCFGRGD